MIDNLEFQIAFGAIKHFGRNLYTSNPPAVAELVANAWDAYAKACKIFYSEDKQHLLIIDNGVGMTDEEFQKRYAVSGYEKNTDIRRPEDMPIRPYMGKKGIGKFSAFSLADTFHLYTKSSEDNHWKKIELNHSILNQNKPIIDIPVTQSSNFDELNHTFNINIIEELGYSDGNTQTGTVIYLPNLKRTITEGTLNSLKKLLPRRFSVTAIINDGNFTLSLQSQELNLKKHFYFNGIEDIYYFGYTKEEIKQLFDFDNNELLKETSLKDRSEGIIKETLKGWIASVSLPQNLKAEDGTKLKGVAIYINGKIADEDIFKNIQDDRIPNSYIIGEVDADYLEDGNIDPVLSSREGLNHELQSVIELRDYLKGLRAEVIDKWNDMRSDRDISKQEYIQRAISKPENKIFYDKLDPAIQKRFVRYAQKLFDQPREDNRQDKIIDMLFSALVQIANDEELQEMLSKTDVDEAEILTYLVKIFNLNEVNHALRLRNSVKGKLDVIKKLKEYITDEEVESSFESLLASSPWILNPYWDARTTVLTQTWHKLVKSNNDDEERVRTDIIFEVSDEPYPIIVELKREKKTNYSAPNVEDVLNQIGNYRKAIVQSWREKHKQDIDPYRITAFLVCGSKALTLLNSNTVDLAMLERNKICTISYEQMVACAEKMLGVMYEQDGSE